jgi:DNA polymerase III subunit epsilon
MGPKTNDEIISALEATGNFRVLRKVSPRRFINTPDGAATKRALFVDVETTGLTPERDEIIELAMVPFTYGMDGMIFEVEEPFQGFQDPSQPISPEITKITGIDQSMVAGQHLDLSAIEGIVSKADIVIAHNAGFDRKFLERFSQVFATMPWGCSATQVDWKSEGFEGTRLGYLLYRAGYFYDQHRALNDCYAAIELLSTTLPVSGKPALQVLLENARAVTWRIWATHAPYDLKDQLKKRGYKWSAGENGTQRAWYVDVSQEQRDAEVAFLHVEIYRYDAPITIKRVDAYDRFSDRT